MNDPLTEPKTAAAKIDELIEENADYFSGWHEAHLGEPTTHGKWKARGMAAEAALEAAQAESAKLRAALRPFAMYPDDPSMDDNKMTGARIPYGTIRAAHAALEQKP